MVSGTIAATSFCFAAARTGSPRSGCKFHRSHFGSRYKLGCCGHAGLFAAWFDSCRARYERLQARQAEQPEHSSAQQGIMPEVMEWAPKSGCNCHRSHFGSRYKLGCCGHAGLFAAWFDSCRARYASGFMDSPKRFDLTGWSLKSAGRFNWMAALTAWPL